MQLVTKAMVLVLVVATVGLLGQWVNADITGERYSYATIPTEDVPDVHTGCGEFEQDGLFLVTIDTPTPVHDGSWRQRTFRGVSLFRSQFEAYGTNFSVTGVKPREGFMVGSATFLEDAQQKLVLWQADEDVACDLTQE